MTSVVRSSKKSELLTYTSRPRSHSRSPAVTPTPSELSSSNQSLNLINEPKNQVFLNDDYSTGKKTDASSDHSDSHVNESVIDIALIQLKELQFEIDVKKVKKAAASDLKKTRLQELKFEIKELNKTNAKKLRFSEKAAKTKNILRSIKIESQDRQEFVRTNGVNSVSQLSPKLLPLTSPNADNSYIKEMPIEILPGNSCSSGNVIENMKQQFLEDTNNISKSDTCSPKSKPKKHIRKSYSSIDGNEMPRKRGRPCRKDKKLISKDTPIIEEEPLFVILSPSNSDISIVDIKPEASLNNTHDFYTGRNLLTKGLREVRKIPGSCSENNSPVKNNVIQSSLLPVSPKTKLLNPSVKSLQNHLNDTSDKSIVNDISKEIVRKARTDLSKKENILLNGQNSSHTNHHITEKNYKANRPSYLTRRKRGRKSKLSRNVSTVIVDVHNTMNGEPQTVIPAKSPVLTKRRGRPPRNCKPKLLPASDSKASDGLIKTAKTLQKSSVLQNLNNSTQLELVSTVNNNNNDICKCASKNCVNLHNSSNKTEISERVKSEVGSNCTKNSVENEINETIMEADKKCSAADLNETSAEADYRLSTETDHNKSTTDADHSTISEAEADTGKSITLKNTLNVGDKSDEDVDNKSPASKVSENSKSLKISYRKLNFKTDKREKIRIYTPKRNIAQIEEDTEQPVKLKDLRPISILDKIDQSLHLHNDNDREQITEPVSDKNVVLAIGSAAADLESNANKLLSKDSLEKAADELASSSINNRANELTNGSMKTGINLLPSTFIKNGASELANSSLKNEANGFSNDSIKNVANYLGDEAVLQNFVIGKTFVGTNTDGSKIHRICLKVNKSPSKYSVTADTLPKEQKISNDESDLKPKCDGSPETLESISAFINNSSKEISVQKGESTSVIPNQNNETQLLQIPETNNNITEKVNNKFKSFKTKTKYLPKTLTDLKIRNKSKTPRILAQLFQDEGVQKILKSVNEEAVANQDVPNDSGQHNLRPKRSSENSYVSESPEPEEGLQVSKRRRKNVENEEESPKTSASPKTSPNSGFYKIKKTQAESDVHKRKLDTLSSEIVISAEPESKKVNSTLGYSRIAPEKNNNLITSNQDKATKIQMILQLKKNLNDLGIKSCDGMTLMQMQDLVAKSKNKPDKVVPPIKIRLPNNYNSNLNEEKPRESSQKITKEAESNLGSENGVVNRVKIVKTSPGNSENAASYTSTLTTSLKNDVKAKNSEQQEKTANQIVPKKIFVNPNKMASNSLLKSKAPPTLAPAPQPQRGPGRPRGPVDATLKNQRPGPVDVVRQSQRTVVDAVRQSQRTSVRCNSENNFNYRDIVLRKYSNFMQIMLAPCTTKMKNSFNSRVIRELCDALNLLKRDDSVSMVLITSIGSSFCQGVDITSLHHPNLETRKKNAESLAKSVRELIRALVLFPKMLVAGVSGAAQGLGATMLPLFDMVFASDKAEFSLPYARLGQVPEGGATYTFPNFYGRLQSNALFMGRKVTACQALQLGLVSEVVWPDTFHEALIPKVAYLADQSAISMEATTATKALMNHHVITKLELSLESECRLLVQQWTSQNFFNLSKKYLDDNNIQMQKPVNIPPTAST